MAVLVDANGLTVRRPDRPLFENIDVTISSGERWGLVGINGTGKSTLLRVLTGTADPESGTVRRARGLRVGILDQEPDLGKGTVQDALGDSWESAAVLERLGVGHLIDAQVSRLSGGQAKRVALARALVQVPGDHDDDLLILDEPTNHLDLDGIEWLEDRLARQKGGLMLVSHDRHLLDKVCTKMLELDRGKGFVHSGGYQGFLDGREAREDRAAAAESTRKNLARRELEWLRRGAPARTAKSKARIASATTIVEGRAEAAARAGSLSLTSAIARSGEGQGPSAGSIQGSFRKGQDSSLAPRLGTKVIELHDVGHAYAGGEQLFSEVEWLLEPGARYGIVGANGSGKTTLLEIVAGRLVPSEGTVEFGPTVRVGYYDQRGRTLDPKQRVREAVAGDLRPVGTPEDKKLMEQFWFDADAQFSPISTLSGGERRRLQLLLVLAERPNVLLLDEPTNDLDLDTLRAIEAFLDDWPGTVIVVSHDRAFLDRTTEDVLLVEDGRASLVAGGYAAWRESRDGKRPAGSSTGGKSASTGGKSAGKKGVVDVVEADPISAPAALVAPVDVAPEAVKKPKGKSGGLMRDLEKEIARLEKKRVSLETDLVAAGSDHVKLTKLGADLASITEQMTAAEERWLELADD
jgi:ABC transport system ATP-binding/permease protein